MIAFWSWNGLTAAGELENERAQLTSRLTDKKQLEAWGLNLREVMDLAIALNGAMTFSWGFIHCDPHPGNILVRKHPWKKGKPQLVRFTNVSS